MPKHVVLVDDDPTMRHLVGDYLASNSYEVSAVADGTAMERVLSQRKADLFILDLQLRNEDGLDLMRRIEDRGDAPVILITGSRNDEIDKVLGLELGADDYITKPFGLREFLARVRSVLRRADAAGAAARNRSDRATYRFGPWRLSTRTRQLSPDEGEPTRLTAGEFNLLTAFLRAPQQVLTRERLLDASRVHNEEVFDRSIDVLILRLRRKIEADPARPSLIRTERGAGYVLTVPVEVV
jgi:two-component system, OmpR family, response regulator